ncbi:uncharacterized protein LOC125940216 isoform X1 [Dermacentor silvarum]|uniref:uncharacterized protein LOC125940216 isoform X1 n=1 Tax=Dermacentor silvarum TaxID=543639 RepID=UPI002101B657|nr:uncharacterized protein LOC125940216 isoform X1 [Dermacentor silvarum]
MAYEIHALYDNLILHLKMFKHSRLSYTILTILCSHIMLFDETSSETLADNGSNLNIIKVLNTSELLWLYWQTSPNDYTETLKDFTINETLTCIRNRMTNISTTEYYFEQTTVLVGKVYAESAAPVKITDYYKGIFVNDTIPPKSMNVYDIDQTPDSPSTLMTLQYTDENLACSVFFVFGLDNSLEDDVGSCVMYIRDSHVKDGPSNGCKTFFQNRCNSTKTYQPYSDDCKKENKEVNQD